MRPVVIPHASYQNFVLEQLQEHFAGGALTFVNKDWPLMAKLWITDLSGVTRFLQDDYDPKGPAPRDPASMLRSYLVFLFTNPTMGITEWVNELYRTPLYAILSGFDPKDIPGVGTFYDFFHRLWGSEKLNLKPNKSRRRRKKPKRGKKKGDKAKAPTPHKVQRLINWMVRHADHRKQLPADRLFDLFQSEILSVSAKLGLLGNLHALGVAGDGTPVSTAAYPRSQPTCDCRTQGLENCHHPRLFSQPDCGVGWDSSRERYFNGYDKYTLTASDSHSDLPLYPRLHTASRHDAISLVVSTVEFAQRFSLGTVRKMLLDSAHDAEAIYIWLNDQGIEPFIDLNPRGKKAYTSLGDITISPEGVPICPAHLKMKPNGYDHAKNRQKWRCPLASKTHNACENPCSTAKYGRTFHTHPADNPRLFPKTPRESEQWKDVYKRRTSIERSNKREKIDYKLEAGRHRSTAMWYIRIYGIAMCQHIDAWFKHLENHLEPLKECLPIAC